MFVREKPMLLTMGKSWFAKLFHSPPNRAAEKLWADAESGNAQAQFEIGLSFSNGSGTARDEQAAAWHLKAANQDHAKAQFVLGAMFADGRGVPKDDGKALMWIGKAAQRGYPEAQHTLGLSRRRASFKEIP